MTKRYQVTGRVPAMFRITVEIGEEYVEQGGRKLENAIQEAVENVIDDGRFDYEFDVGSVDVSGFKPETGQEATHEAD